MIDNASPPPRGPGHTKGGRLPGSRVKETAVMAESSVTEESCEDRGRTRAGV
jgi:hypothetical protein